MATIGQGYAMQQLIDKQRQGGRGHTFGTGEAAFFGGPFNYRGGTPSTNLPDFQGQYGELAAGIRGRDVAAPFSKVSNELNLSRAMDLEALDRQRLAEQQQHAAQSVDRGFEMLGGDHAAEQRHRQAIERGGQQHSLAQSQLGRQEWEAKERAEMQAAMMEQKGIESAQRGWEVQQQADLQRELFAEKARVQFQMQRLEDEQRERDRVLRREEGEATRKYQREALAAQRQANNRNYSLQLAGLRLQSREIDRKYAQLPPVQMFASAVSPGGGGNPNVNPASRHAWA